MRAAGEIAVKISMVLLIVGLVLAVKYIVN